MKNKFRIGDIVRIIVNPNSPDSESFYGHYLGDIGIVRHVDKYGDCAVEVNGRKSTSVRKPSVVWYNIHLENITRKTRIDNLLKNG